MLLVFPHRLSPEMELSLLTLYPVESLLTHNLRMYGWNGGLWNKQFYLATLLSNKGQQGFLWCLRLHMEINLKAWMTFAKETYKYIVCQSIYTSRSNPELYPLTSHSPDNLWYFISTQASFLKIFILKIRICLMIYCSMKLDFTFSLHPDQDLARDTDILDLE